MGFFDFFFSIYIYNYKNLTLTRKTRWKGVSAPDESQGLEHKIGMKKLEERIRYDGIVKPGEILKVDMFLNHQLDPQLFYEMALEWKSKFEGQEINKIVTIEASGIALAIMVGFVFNCPVVFAKKSKSKNISDNLWMTEVVSFTHGNTNNVVISKEYLGPNDKVLIIDDFLATGAALVGLIDLCEQAGAEVVGCGIAVEKTYQNGGAELRSKGYKVESLAMIESMSDNGLTFVGEK